MATALPTACTVALKEWATVIEAMGRGEQVVLIRKGGLIEPGSGFEIVSPSFVFYPTFEHQTAHYIRPDFQPDFEQALQRRPPEGRVRVELFGMAVSSSQTQDAGIIERLRDFHIYNEAFVTQRLKWQPQQPLAIVVIRTFRLAQPATIAVTPRYAGCKSWVELETQVSLEGAAPVIEERAFQERLKQLTYLLASS